MKEFGGLSKTTSNPPTIDDEGISSHSSYSDGEVALYILRDMEITLNITGATTTEEWGHWEGILEERNKRNNNTTSDREVVINILRDLKATLNANPTKAITTAERP